MKTESHAINLYFSSRELILVASSFLLTTFLKFPFLLIYCSSWEILGFPHSSVGKESAGNAGDLGLIPGMGRLPGEGNGNPLPYSSLENPKEREARRATYSP